MYFGKKLIVHVNFLHTIVIISLLLGMIWDQQLSTGLFCVVVIKLQLLIISTFDRCLNILIKGLINVSIYSI